MTVRYEIFAAGSPSPDDLWAVVGDPWRLPEWTDATRVESVEPDPIVPGGHLTVEEAGQRLQWRLTTVEPRLLEAVTQTPRGEVGIGVHVRPDPLGSRLILAGMHETQGPVAGLRVRALDAPALRRRFDRWAQRALKAAS